MIYSNDKTNLYNTVGYRRTISAYRAMITYLSVVHRSFRKMLKVYVFSERKLFTLGTWFNVYSPCWKKIITWRHNLHLLCRISVVDWIARTVPFYRYFINITIYFNQLLLQIFNYCKIFHNLFAWASVDLKFNIV